MKTIFKYLFALLSAVLYGCTTGSLSGDDAAGTEGLTVRISEMQETGPATRINYSGSFNEHSEFETGDFFGMFVIDETVPTVRHFKVYCSGIDNKGKTVWSIYKAGASDGHSSNYPISEIVAMGRSFFAYYPYNAEYETSLPDIEGIKAIVPAKCNALPTDQSNLNYSDLDFIVASNVPGAEFGEFTILGKNVSLNFAHTMSRLRLLLPAGAKKYEYLFDGTDFTPNVRSWNAELDEYNYFFKPGCILDISMRYVLDKHLYKIETGNLKNIFPQRTLAGHCYYLDENAPKVPYSIGVDMGTSVMWASFNLGAETDRSATAVNVSSLKGINVCWGANKDFGQYGQRPYQNYNDKFTGGTKPSELAIDYEFSGNVLYDAATNLWGGKWRTPSIQEWLELFDACTCVVSNNVITFTSKTTSNVISIGCFGYMDGPSISQPTIGYYWSSSGSPQGITKGYAIALHKTASSKPVGHPVANRYTGLPVRPVYTK